MRRRLMILTFGLLTLAGCSAGGGQGVTPSPDDTGPVSPSAPTSDEAPPTSGPVPEIAADLTVTVVDGGTRTFQLTCSPDGGDHPRAADACAQLNQVGPSIFAEPPADEVCTEIYGGPQIATVTGTFGGTPVDARFARSNGCEIDRWNSVAALFAL